MALFDFKAIDAMLEIVEFWSGVRKSFLDQDWDKDVAEQMVLEITKLAYSQSGKTQESETENTKES